MAHSCTLKELATVKRLHVAEELLYTRFPVVFSKTPPDVEITVFNDVYHSHSALLRNASPFFEESLSDRWWTPENTHDGHDGIRYKYRLSINIHFLRSSMLEPVPAGEGDSHEPRGRPDDTLSSSSKPMPAEEDDSHEPRGRSPDATSSSRSRRYSSEPINILNSVNTNSSDNDRLQVQIFLNEIEAMKSAYAELFRIFHGRGPVPVPSGSNRNHDRIFEHADMLVYLAEKFSCFEEYS